MKTHVKKKAFQHYCREQVKNGLINQADGNWKPADSNKWQDQHCINGYRFNRGGRAKS